MMFFLWNQARCIFDISSDQHINYSGQELLDIMTGLDTLKINNNGSNKFVAYELRSFKLSFLSVPSGYRFVALVNTRLNLDKKQLLYIYHKLFVPLVVKHKDFVALIPSKLTNNAYAEEISSLQRDIIYSRSSFLGQIKHYFSENFTLHNDLITIH